MNDGGSLCSTLDNDDDDYKSKEVMNKNKKRHIIKTEMKAKLKV